MAQTKSTRHNIVTRCLAAVALVSVYCVGIIGASAVLLTSATTSAEARGGGRGGGGGVVAAAAVSGAVASAGAAGAVVVAPASTDHESLHRAAITAVAGAGWSARTEAIDRHLNAGIESSEGRVGKPRRPSLLHQRSAGLGECIDFTEENTARTQQRESFARPLEQKIRTYIFEITDRVFGHWQR